MSSKRILIVRAGVPGPAVMARHGDFVRWFEDTVGPGLRIAVADGIQGPLPGPDAQDGVIVTGSFDSVTRRAPWMEALGRWLVEVGQTVPVLGVCFGHQLLGHALGGRVERNPLGPEAGTREVELTEAGSAASSSTPSSTRSGAGTSAGRRRGTWTQRGPGWLRRPRRPSGRRPRRARCCETG